MRTHVSPRDLALTLAVVALLGYTFVPMKIALAEVPPFTLAALRFLLAAAPMVFFVRPPSMPWHYVVAYGFAIGVCQFGLLFLGIKLGMPAGLSSLVIQMQVFFTIGPSATSSRSAAPASTALISPFALLIPVSGIASGALFLGESLAPIQLAGAALAFTGLVYNVYGLRLRALLVRARKR